MEEDERNSSDDMESLFAGMDFVAPAFSASVLSTSSSAAAAAAASPPLSKDPTLSPSLEESVLPQGDLASVAPVLLSPSQQQQPRLTPSSSIHGFVFQPPGEPLDESLFSGLSLASTTSDVTASQSAEVLEVIASPSPPPPPPPPPPLPLPPSAIVTSFVEDRTDEMKLERMSSMGSEESGTGDRDVSSVQSIMAAYNDVPPSSRSLPAGIPVGAATLAGSKPLMRRKKRGGRRIGYDREGDGNEEVGQVKVTGGDNVGGSTALKFATDDFLIPSHSLVTGGLHGMVSEETETLGSLLSQEVDREKPSTGKVSVQKRELLDSVDRETSHLGSSFLDIKGESITEEDLDQNAVLTVSNGIKLAIDESSEAVQNDTTPQELYRMASDKEQLPILPLEVTVIPDHSFETSDQTTSKAECRPEDTTETESGVEVNLTGGECPTHSLKDGNETAPIESIIETPHQQGGTAAGQNELTIEMKFNLIKQAIATKLKSLKERGLLVSAKRKDAAQKRRQAAEIVASESARHKDLEAQLEVACETEDFEKADDLSGKILESEKTQEEAVRVFTVAEVECDQIAAEMQEVLDLEIEIEEQGAQLLQALTKEAEKAMERVKLEAQGTARQGFNELDAEEKTVQLERLKVSSELQLADEALRDLNNAVAESTKTKAEQKLLLMKKRELLDLELQELLAKVRAKELEISEADEHISEVDKEISMLEAATDQQHVATNTKVEGLRMALMELDTKSSSLTEQRDGLKAVLSDMEAERLNLERLAKIAMADGLAMHEAMETKKGAAALISQSREKMMHLAAKEKQATEEVHALRQEALVARASLQEVVGVKVKLQQEMAAAKQRILFVEKRGPELEAEKKLAASARNFKEAGRLAAEAKALMAEKEDLTGNIAQISSRIHALEEEGVAKVDALAEMDELVAVKEKEGAVARCERLRLLATAARRERDAAIDLDDLQEAENLEIEVEAAEQEADELQRLFNLEEQKYARVVEIPASGVGSKMREQPHGADEMFDISTEEAPEMKDIADEQPIEAENI